MPEQHRTFTLTAALALFLTACAGAGGTRSGPAAVVDGAAPMFTLIPDDRTATAMIDYLTRLNALDPTLRDTFVESAINNFTSARTPTNTLALALALQAANPNEHDDALESLLAATPTPPEPLLTAVHQCLVRHDRIRRNRRVEAARTRRIAELEAALVSQSSSAQANTKTLRLALEHAEAKIRALTSIEEEIERSDITGVATP